MIKVLSVLLLATSALASDMIKVAIIDTGLDLTDPRFKNALCLTGHRDFTHSTLYDDNGHGTHVAGLIVKYAKTANYCLVIYKVFGPDDTMKIEPYQAFNQAIKDGVDIINFSAGGHQESDAEREVIKSHPEVTVVAAAGNDGRSLDDSVYRFYPVSYRLSNILAIGALEKDGTKSSRSNYGSFVEWEVGIDVLSTLPRGRYGFMSGSSMATAVRTGKLVFKRRFK